MLLLQQSGVVYDVPYVTEFLLLLLARGEEASHQIILAADACFAFFVKEDACMREIEGRENYCADDCSIHMNYVFICMFCLFGKK